MVLVTEHKLAEFISPPLPGDVLEASGVIAKGADYYVIFDNVRRIARVHRSLDPGSKRHSWFGRKRDGEGYEDIAFDPQTSGGLLIAVAERVASRLVRRLRAKGLDVAVIGRAHPKRVAWVYLV